MEPRLVFVLGASHRVQGWPMFRGSVRAPGYSEKLNTIMAEESVDFIFEEGSGFHTIARGVAEIASTRYLDVDPHPSVAHSFGIVDSAGHPFPEDIAPEELVKEQAKREEFWYSRIAKEDFKSGLLVCGYLHTLSMAFRLLSGGFRVKYADYLPHG